MLTNIHQMILLSLIYISLSWNWVSIASEPVDLINFNVYQNGTKTYGHFKVKDWALKSDFWLNQRNSTHTEFALHSRNPWPLEVFGDYSIVGQDKSKIVVKGRLTSLTHQLKIKLDSNVTLTPSGPKFESAIDFKIPNTINGTYLLNLGLMDDGCWPVDFSHNLTIYPPELITYHAGFKGSCNANNNNTRVDLDSSIRSAEWPFLNSDIKQYWVFNSSGGYESMNSTHSLYDIDVIADWTNIPPVKHTKIATFRSKSSELPSFKIKYLVDGEDSQLLYEKIVLNN